MCDISKPLVISLIFTINPGIWENSAFSQEQNVPFDAPLRGTYSYNYSANAAIPGDQGAAEEAMTLPLTGTLMTAASSTITIPYSNETLTTTAGRQDIGGNGVDASPENGRNEAGLGTGGSDLTITLNGDSATNSLTVTPANSGAVGVLANSVGGNGGNGWDSQEGDSDGVDAGGGGGGGIGITATGYVNITTSGDNAIGVQAASAGGTGGVAGDAENGPGNTGGYGGSGGDVKVDFSKSTAVITASGANAFGVLATSIAGDAGDNSANTEEGQQATGSHGGNSGTVDVTMGDSTTINTSGNNAVGIVARSVSGKGGMGGISIAHGTGDGGDGGNGGKTGVITLNADGTITTHGTGAMGIFAQAAAGGGGAGGASEATFGGDAGQAGNGANPAAIYITNSGSITTNDGYAPGILGLSLSGAGGIGGSASGMFDANGGAGGTSPDAGVVNIIHSGTITTKNDNAQGIVAQPIAGGGGMGGDAGGMFDTHGSSGGTGGAGGTIYPYPWRHDRHRFDGNLPTGQQRRHQ